MRLCESMTKGNFAPLIFLLMILSQSQSLTEALGDPNDKGPDLISHLNLIRAQSTKKLTHFLEALACDFLFKTKAINNPMIFKGLQK